MKKISLFLMAVLVLSMLVGCAAQQAVDRLEEKVEQMAEPETKEGMISKEQAQNIALAQAALTAEQVHNMRTQYEIDDGVAQYDVEFAEGKWEYEFEIDAYTGAVLSFDKDTK